MWSLRPSHDRSSSLVYWNEKTRDERWEAFLLQHGGKDEGPYLCVSLH